jgi:hypothetical protein
MRICIPLLALTCLACQASPPAGGGTEPPAKPASTSPGPNEAEDKAGAAKSISLLPGADFRGFRRVPIDPLADKPVWQVRDDGSLFIDGVGAKEMLLYETEFTDGTLHVEWRFLKGTGEKPVYNGGVYVRTPLDGKHWVQLQMAHADKAPVVGDLIAQVPGKAERIDVFQSKPSPAVALGEWNSYDITARGKSIELVVNGQPTVTWSDCPLATGYVGLQAEGSPIEVRAMKFTPL